MLTLKYGHFVPVARFLQHPFNMCCTLSKHNKVRFGKRKNRRLSRNQSGVICIEFYCKTRHKHNKVRFGKLQNTQLYKDPIMSYVLSFVAKLAICKRFIEQTQKFPGLTQIHLGSYNETIYQEFNHVI